MHKNLVLEYTAFLKKFLNPRKKLKVIFDCSNGTTGLILKKVFSNHKLLSVSYLNGTPNGNFPGHGPNPMLKGATLELRSAVKKQKADLGGVFDADGDRVFIVDNRGRLAHPDVTARLLVSYLQPRKIVINVPTGWLIRNLKGEMPGLKIFEAPVGYYFMTKLMQETDSDFAAEHSAHYYFKDFFCRDAGILAAIRIIDAVSELPYPLSQFIDFLPQYYRSWELNFTIKDGEGLTRTIKKNYDSRAEKVSTLDGLTMKFDDYWFNLRPSNNEPLIRLNVEATSEKLLEEKTKELREIISHPKF